MSEKGTDNAEFVAQNTLNSLNNLKRESDKQQDFENNSKASPQYQQQDDSQIYEPPEEHQPTLFMMNNNSPQPNSYEPYMKNVKAYNQQNNENRTRYGTTALIFAGIAVVCALILIIAMIINQPNADSASSVLGWLVLTILAPTLGLFGSVICALISAVVGIVGLCKAHSRVISWVGFFVGLIVLAGVVITACAYLF